MSIRNQLSRSRSLTKTHFMAAAMAICATGAAPAQPITGRPVPALAQFDSLMTGFMNGNGIEAGLLGVMKDGQIVYLRGFGWQDAGVPMPENAMVRVASITKMVTAAATRQLIDDGDFALSTKAFNLNQPGGGLLPYLPFPSLGDQRLKDVTVDHLLRHRGGWNRDAVGDVTYKELEIAGDMNVTSPPGRVNTIRWILGQPLQFTPGTQTNYSNVGSLALGLIIEQTTGQGLIEYARENVLTPEMWVPSTDLRLGATFREWGHAREPWYRTPLVAPNVFQSFGLPIVSAPYGSWDHEARVGQGGMVLSAATMLRLAQHYHLGAGSTKSGLPITESDPVTSAASHGGMLLGVSTLLWQRPDGVNVFVFFNANAIPTFDFDEWQFVTSHYGNQFRALIDPVLDGGTIQWPTTTSDGAWALPTSAQIGGVGAYDAPFRGFAHTLAVCVAGTRVRLKSGSSTWSGTISKRLELSAPLGTVTIGQ